MLLIIRLPADSFLQRLNISNNTTQGRGLMTGLLKGLKQSVTKGLKKGATQLKKQVASKIF